MPGKRDNDSEPKKALTSSPAVPPSRREAASTAEKPVSASSSGAGAGSPLPLEVELIGAYTAKRRKAGR